jgi:hypothetical protein
MVRVSLLHVTKYKNHGLCSISNNVHCKYLTILVSEKIELACLSDAHAALKNLSKKKIRNNRCFKPRAAPNATIVIQTRCHTYPN